jgi:hypothetical protein
VRGGEWMILPPSQALVPSTHPTHHTLRFHDYILYIVINIFHLLFFPLPLPYLSLLHCFARRRRPPASDMCIYTNDRYTIESLATVDDKDGGSSNSGDVVNGEDKA